MPTRVRPEARLRPSSEIPRDTAESLARHILHSPILASSMAWSGNFNMLARRNAGTAGKTTAHLVAMERAGASGFRESHAQGDIASAVQQASKSRIGELRTDKTHPLRAAVIA